MPRSERKNNSSQVKRLYRSETDRILGGVCGGLGEFFGIDPVIIRLLFIVFVFAGGGGVILYLLLWLIVPTESKVGSAPRDAIRQGAREMRERAMSARGRIERDSHMRAHSILGLIIILMGVALLASELNILSWGKFWAVFLIFAGVVLLFKGMRKKE